MDEYVAKPIRAKQLFQTISALLGCAGGSNEQSHSSPADEEEETFDFSEALRTVRGDHELLKEIVEAFLDESPRLMTEIRQAVSAGDATALRVAVHTLKSSMRYFGAARAFEQAYQLEKMGRMGDLENAESPLQTLEGEIARLTPVLIDYVRGDDEDK